MTNLTIERQDYGLPAMVSLDTFRRKGVIISTKVEVLTHPSSEIVFWLNSDGNHKGTATYSLSGQVSPQGRQREELSQSVAIDIYRDCIVLQKEAAYSPSVAMTQAILNLASPDAEVSALIDQSAPSSEAYHQKLKASCFNGAMTLLIVEGFIREGRGAMINNMSANGLVKTLRDNIARACDILIGVGYMDMVKLKEAIQSEGEKLEQGA